MSKTEDIAALFEVNKNPFWLVIEFH